MKIWMVTATADRSQAWRDRLVAARPEWEVRIWEEGQAPWQADYAVVWQPPAAFFEQQPGVQALFNLGAGVEALLAIPSLPADVPLVRMEGVGMDRQMAEFVLHGVLHVARSFDQYDRQQRERAWVPGGHPYLHEWPIGVLGLGVIGRTVAEMLAGHGFPVAGWARSARDLPGIETFAGLSALPDFLARTRVLVNVLPLTADTENLIDRQVLGGLMPDAYFINIARGAHVVDEDLLAALAAGQLRGALLDVFREEPLPADHPYWTHPGVRVTPHISGQTDVVEGCRQMVGKLEAMSRGEPVTGIVSRERGY